VPVDPHSVAAIVDHPHPLAAYRRWLADQASAAPNSDYLFAEQRVRFEPRKDDRVVVRPGLTANMGKRKAARLVDAAAGIDLPVPGVSAKQATALLRATDGERRLLEVQWAAGVDRATMGAWLRATFGKLVFAPDAVAALEARIPGSDVVRFPVAPYAIERAYWENQADVRERLSPGPPGPTSEFLRWLRELHVTTLMGASLDRFYKPASPIADRSVRPGALFEDPVRCLDGRDGPIYLDGPRVHLPTLAGEAYQRALRDSVRDQPLADWGRVVVARSEMEPEAKTMFLPPRPMGDEHFEALRQAFVEAEGAIDEASTIQACAAFHQRWVRLHPFRCANQSLAMNIVNAWLARRFGSGIPHLLLDHLALEYGESAYAELFRRAVAVYVIRDDDPGSRLAALVSRYRASLAAIEALDRGVEPEQLDPKAASAALLR
jgi:hypothetical protein